jgi:hypothetical protein
MVIVMANFQELQRRAEEGGHGVLDMDLLCWAQNGFHTVDGVSPDLAFGPGVGKLPFISRVRRF